MRRVWGPEPRRPWEGRPRGTRAGSRLGQRAPMPPGPAGTVLRAGPAAASCPQLARLGPSGPGRSAPSIPRLSQPCSPCLGGALGDPAFCCSCGAPVCGAHNTQVSPPPRVSSLSARVVFTRVASWSARCSVKEMCDSPVSPGAGEGRGGPGVRPTRTGSGGRGECVSVMAQCWVTGRRPLWLGPWVLPDVARRASCGPFFWKICSSGSWV